MNSVSDCSGTSRSSSNDEFSRGPFQRRPHHYQPQLFLFRVRQPEDTLRDISESVMRTVVGDRTVDEVITIGRQEIETEALLKMQVL